MYAKMTALFLFILALAFSSQARADIYLNCNAYAGTAVQQFHESQQLGCGFSGLAWSADFNGHANWCKSSHVKMQDLTREENNRKAALQQCKLSKQNARPANAPSQQECKNYANAMVSFAKANTENKCGLKGGRFANNYDGHFNWCNNGPTRKTVSEELSKSKSAIDQCVNAKKVRTYSGKELILHRGVRLDVCTEDHGDFCGKFAADSFCVWKKHKKSVSHKSGTTSFTVHLNCIIDGTAGKANKDGCFCNGTCGYFKEITCR